MRCTLVNLCVEPQVLPVGLPENSQGEKRPVIASLGHKEMAVSRGGGIIPAQFVV